MARNRDTQGLFTSYSIVANLKGKVVTTTGTFLIAHVD